MTDKPEVPIRVLPPVFTPVGVTVKYRQPLEYFDGERWQLLATDAVEWFKSRG